jgi:AcrR family transcriptional regulator
VTRPAAPSVRADVLRNQQALLDAALEVLSRDPDASMAEVAEASGLARTTVYRHFPSREHLVRGLFEQVSREAVRDVRAIVEEGDAADVVLRRIAVDLVALGARYRFLDRHQELVAEQLRRELPDDPLRDWVVRATAAGELRAGLTFDWVRRVVGALAAAASDDVTAGRWTADQAARELGETLVAAFVRSR